jgi:hypothetical protein
LIWVGFDLGFDLGSPLLNKRFSHMNLTQNTIKHYQ